MGILHNVDVDRIKNLAKSQGITMTFLAQSIGKYRNFLSAVRLGADRIHDDELLVIADRLHTTTDYLTGQTDDPEIPGTEKGSPISMEKAALINLVRSLPDDDVRKISEYVDFIISHRNRKKK